MHSATILSSSDRARYVCEISRGLSIVTTAILSPFFSHTTKREHSRTYFLCFPFAHNTIQKRLTTRVCHCGVQLLRDFTQAHATLHIHTFVQHVKCLVEQEKEPDKRPALRTFSQPTRGHNHTQQKKDRKSHVETRKHTLFRHHLFCLSLSWAQGWSSLLGARCVPPSSRAEQKKRRDRCARAADDVRSLLLFFTVKKEYGGESGRVVPNKNNSHSQLSQQSTTKSNTHTHKRSG